MLKLKRIISVLLAVITAAGLCTAPCVMAAETQKVLFADFTSPEAETLPMHNPGAPNDGGRMKKNTDIYYGDAVQSGRWAVTGSNSSLSNYDVAAAGIDLEAAAGCNIFVIRFYSSTDNDAFNVLFYDAESTYYRYGLYVTKAGWQEAAIPVSAIEEDVAIVDITSFVLQKGGWGINSSVFNQQNVLCFDSMWFENRNYNTAMDADSPERGLAVTGASSTITRTSDFAYSDSAASWVWTTSATSARTIKTADFDTLNLDSRQYGKATFRVYSEAYDEVVLLFYYTDGTGVQKYYRQTYYFTEDDGTVGKWIEIPVQLTDTGYSLDYIALNYNGWGTAHNVANRLYIDKIWLGETEDINASFGYVSSAYDGADDVGVFDAIALEFDDYLSGDVACDAVEVMRGGNPVTEFEAWSDKKTLYIKTDAAMAFDASYEITVTTALTSQIGRTLGKNQTIRFHTRAPYLAIDTVALVDAAGEELTQIPAVGSAVSATAEIVNGSEAAVRYVILLAMYDSEGTLLGVQMSGETEFEANMAVSHSITASGAVAENTASIRGFLWSGTGTMIPYGIAAL